MYPGSSYEATGVPRHLLLVMLVDVLASLATRMRVRGAACAPGRQAGRDPRLLDHLQKSDSSKINRVLIYLEGFAELTLRFP